jgi:hypothetical protein
MHDDVLRSLVKRRVCDRSSDMGSIPEVDRNIGVDFDVDRLIPYGVGGRMKKSRCVTLSRE